MSRQWILTDLLCLGCGAVQRSLLPVSWLRTVDAWKCPGCDQVTAHQVGVAVPVDEASELFAEVDGDAVLQTLRAHRHES